MGRKTKKEKIIADFRRKISNLEKEEKKLKINEDKNKSVYFPTALKPASVTTASNVQSQSIYIYPVQLIKKDLTKTIILSILAISFEVALFLILQGKIKLPAINISLPVSFNFS